MNDKFPSIFPNVTFLRNLESVNTKTIYLGLNPVETLFFALLFAGYPCFLVRSLSKPQITKFACMYSNALAFEALTYPHLQGRLRIVGAQAKLRSGPLK